MRKRLILGVVAGLLLVTTVITDRVTASAAAGRLTERLRCAAGLSSDPSVSFGGFPFLSQLALGTFDSIRVAADDVPAGRYRVGVEATATGVRLPDGGAVRADSLKATITIGYDLLRAAGATDGSTPTAVAGLLDEVTADDSGHLLFSATRTLFGRKIPVTVIATPEISGGELTVRPVEVEVPSAGLRLPATRFGALKQLPSAGLPELPGGLSWTGVTATPDGLRLSVEGTGLTTDTLAAGSSARCGSPGGTA
ncbi:DUF2993 domain-containing protein [Actinoplanes sichuanensis]|uniref:DUF2993 domain-containing protein n=1 Tax=Actinoplanes sichuanensis TaxID=512349 RepID=A0ABW4A091_9ACTN|nr:DUF2993 domain-containing protein [Actinoplanes sichuanensis]BEL08004.1 DUF2993 domain-containing protein [Actinoplanes sichuanensis]